MARNASALRRSVDAPAQLEDKCRFIPDVDITQYPAHGKQDSRVYKVMPSSARTDVENRINKAKNTLRENKISLHMCAMPAISAWNGPLDWSQH